MPRPSRDRHRPPVACLYVAASGVAVMLALLGCATTPRDPARSSELCKEAFYLTGERKYGEAVALLRESVQCDPTNAKAHHLLGACYDRIGKPMKAAKHFERATELDPSLSNY